MNILWILLPVASAEPARFHPGRGPEQIEITTDGTIAGVPVTRTGAVLARVDDPAALAALDGVGSVVVQPGDGHVVRITAAAGADEIALSRRLWARSDVGWAHPDLAFRLVPHDLPDDPFVGDQWHLENIGQSSWTPGVDVDAPTAWAFATGTGAIVAILDTGVDLEHPDLVVTAGHDYLGDDDDPSPDLDYSGGPHGTSAAGLAAAVGGNGVGVAGVAYDGEVYAIRLIGGNTQLSDIRNAFVEAVDAGAWVISNSWGFYDDCTPFPNWSSLEDANEYAELYGRGGRGSAVVVSAGNGNCDMSEDGFQQNENVISVAAADGDDEREWYSNYGELVDIAAPAGGVLTTDVSGEDGYGSWRGDDDYTGDFSGTSASAPIVAGVLALMFDANPMLTAAEAREVLCETAVRIDLESQSWDSSGWSPYYGCGRVDAGAAVAAVANTPPTTPAVVGPLDEVPEGRALLVWEPADDVDGDWLSYEVIWAMEGGETHTESVDGTMLDLTGSVVAGDVLTWTVAAVDAWGTGAWSEGRQLTVVADPERPDLPESGRGCSTAPGRAPSTPLAALVLLFATIALRAPKVPKAEGGRRRLGGGGRRRPES